MSDVKKIKTALVSVFHKDGLDEILSMLNADGVKFLSTGGTKSFIESLGYSCQAVEDLTGYPSILGGRVKTLHPKVFGGILNRRDNEGDRQQISQYEIPEIDLVIGDLYPFEATVASGASDEDIIEKIDIGGISLIRGAAKNYNDVVIVASKQQYAPLAEMLRTSGASSTLQQRRWFAKEAFAVSSGYDSAIYNYFAGEDADDLRIVFNGQRAMRYGENPHQKGFFYGDLNTEIDEIVAEEINKIFFEVIIAPSYTEGALKVLEQKKNRIILVQKQAAPRSRQFRSVLNGALVQDRDTATETPDMLTTVTKVAPTVGQIADLLFANKIVKQSKSNAIVLAKNGQLYASGIGQTSRVDALRQAIAKAQSFGFDLNGAVMASDAFFPFADCVEIADQAGITAVIHPGGSIRDNDSVEYCDAHGMAMVTTGIRHFKH